MGLSLRGQTSGAVDINAPAVAGDNTITLPDGNGSANQFYKNSTTAGIVTHSSMIEDASGRVGIGTDDPSNFYKSPLVVRNQSSNETNLTLLVSATNQRSGLFFADGASGNDRYAGQIYYNHDTDMMQFATNYSGESSYHFNITSDGGVGINTRAVPAGVNVAVGGTIRVQDSTDASQYLTINHQGIDFQNTGAGSSTTATAHTLDDYEEGTWTPLARTGTTGGGDGNYVKIGSHVHVAGYIEFDDISTAGSDVIVGNLPFLVNQRGIGSVFAGYLDSGKVPNATYANPTTTYMYFYISGNAGVNYAALEHDEISSASNQFFFSISYRTN